MLCCVCSDFGSLALPFVLWVCALSPSHSHFFRSVLLILLLFTASSLKFLRFCLWLVSVNLCLIIMAKYSGSDSGGDGGSSSSDGGGGGNDYGSSSDNTTSSVRWAAVNSSMDASTYETCLYRTCVRVMCVIMWMLDQRTVLNWTEPNRTGVKWTKQSEIEWERTHSAQGTFCIMQVYTLLYKWTTYIQRTANNNGNIVMTGTAYVQCSKRIG